MNLKYLTLLLNTFIWYWLGDPANYPVEFDFSNITYDSSVGGFKKEQIELQITNEGMFDEQAGFLRTNRDDTVVFAGKFNLF